MAALPKKRASKFPVEAILYGRQEISNRRSLLVCSDSRNPLFTKTKFSCSGRLQPRPRIERESVKMIG